MNMQRVEAGLQLVDGGVVSPPQLLTADVLVVAAFQRTLHRLQQVLHQP